MTAALAHDVISHERYERLTREELESELARYKEVVGEVSRVCREAARGNLEPRLLGIEGEGDLAEMQVNLNHLLDLTDAFVREAGASLTAAAEGHFYRRLLPHGLLGAFRRGAQLVNAATDKMREAEQKLEQARDDRLHLADAFQESIMGVVGQVASASGRLRENADELASIAASTMRDARVVADATESSSERLNVIAVATEELTATVGEITKQTNESSTVAKAAVHEATRSYRQVESLETASQKIQTVVKLITEVAGQTRLLALNATIEAARAGDAGRGFAVVASEVKDLAVQTAGATNEIEEQIDSIQKATRDAVQAMRSIEGTIGKMADVTSIVEHSVSEQRIASLEISGNVTASATQMRDMAGAVESMSEGTRRTAESAEHLRGASSALTELSDALRASVGRFVAQIRG